MVDVKNMTEEQFKKYQLRKILELLQDAESEYFKLSNETRDEILEAHHEESSLPYCLRWGLTACEELLQE